MGMAVCFSCSKILDEGDSLRVLTRACTTCLDTIASSGEEKLTEYLESLELPAAVLARDHVVLAANSRFYDTAVLETSDVTGGQALGCMYAGLLGRCGETVTCTLCSLKRSIEQTLETGNGLRGVQYIYPHKEDIRREFAITTEKLGDAVLLLMEK